MNKKIFNGWFLYWVILLLVNFVAYVLSLVAGDFLGSLLCAFMILFCAIGVKQNIQKQEE